MALAGPPTPMLRRSARVGPVQSSILVFVVRPATRFRATSRAQSGQSHPRRICQSHACPNAFEGFPVVRQSDGRAVVDGSAAPLRQSPAF
eukprot:6782575-Lingulodinium_polyedra.AAC.1